MHWREQSFQEKEAAGDALTGTKTQNTLTGKIFKGRRTGKMTFT